MKQLGWQVYHLESGRAWRGPEDRVYRVYIFEPDANAAMETLPVVIRHQYGVRFVEISRLETTWARSESP